MNDNQILLLVVAVIYLIECFFLIKRDTFVFLNLFGLRWHPAYSSSILGNYSKGAIFSNPLPPLGITLFCQSSSISLSPDSIYSYASLAPYPGGRVQQHEKYFRLDDIKKISSYDNKIMINGADFAKALSHRIAKALADLIERLIRGSKSERSSFIKEAIERSLDTEAIQLRMQDYYKHARWLKIVSNLIFLYLFAACPVVVFYFGLAKTWFILLPLLLLLMVLNARLFFHAHKILFPDEGAARIQSLFLILLVPTTSIRANDYLSCYLLDSFHPLAVAKVLCCQKDFELIAKRFILDAQHPIQPVCPADDTEICNTEKWFRESYLSLIEDFIKKNVNDFEALVQHPQQGSSSAVTYCPRCHTQFAITDGKCLDCNNTLVLHNK